MNKKAYERASLEVVAFDAKDIITTSGENWTGSGKDPVITPEDMF